MLALDTPLNAFWHRTIIQKQPFYGQYEQEERLQQVKTQTCPLCLFWFNDPKPWLVIKMSHRHSIFRKHFFSVYLSKNAENIHVWPVVGSSVAFRTTNLSWHICLFYSRSLLLNSVMIPVKTEYPKMSQSYHFLLFKYFERVCHASFGIFSAVQCTPFCLWVFHATFMTVAQ